MTDCFVLQVNKPLFRKLIEEFEDFRDEVFQIAKEREKESIKLFEREEQGTKMKEEIRLGTEEYLVFST